MDSVWYDLDLSSGMLHWSEALYDAYGYVRTIPANTIEWWTEHIHPDDAMILNQALDGLLNPSTLRWTVEYRFQKADNSYVLVVDNATVTRDSMGNPIRLSGSLTPKTS